MCGLGSAQPAKRDTASLCGNAPCTASALEHGTGSAAAARPIAAQAVYAQPAKRDTASLCGNAPCSASALASRPVHASAVLPARRGNAQSLPAQGFELCSLV